MSNPKLTTESSSIEDTRHRIHDAAASARSKSAGALKGAGRLGSSGGHAVFAELVNGIIGDLQAHLPDDLERVIESFASGLLDVDLTFADADRTLGQAARGAAGAVGANPSRLAAALAEQPRIASTSGRSKTWVRDLAELSGCAERKSAPPAGFVEVETSPPGSNYDYTVYAYTKADGTLGYVCAFGGTEGAADWRDNAIDAAGLVDGQYKNAVAVAQRLAAPPPKGYGAGNVTFTGHSLGGGLAAVASIATGSAAVTFNAAHPGAGDVKMAAQAGKYDVTTVTTAGGHIPLAVEIPSGATSHITDFYAPDDNLTKGELHSALGHQVKLAGSDPYHVTPSDFLSPADGISHAVGHNHGITHVINDIDADHSTYWKLP